MNKHALVLLSATIASAAMVGCGDVEEKPGTTTSTSSSSSASGSSSSSSGEVGGMGGAGGIGGMGGVGGIGGMGGMGGAGGMGGMASSSSSSSSSGMGGAGGSGAPKINGCVQATADDYTAMSTATIQITGLSYTPACIRVKQGTVVTFGGDFVSHPLQGGAVKNGIPTADPMSPITLTNAGMSAMFTLSNIGDVPYYCTNHAAAGMMGAIFVEP